MERKELLLCTLALMNIIILTVYKRNHRKRVHNGPFHLYINIENINSSAVTESKSVFVWQWENKNIEKQRKKTMRGIKKTF